MYGYDVDKYYYYCPICGYEYHYGMETCYYHKDQKFIQSKHPKEWYEEVAEERRIKENKPIIMAFNILKEEYMQNPLFDIDSYNSINKKNMQNLYNNINNNSNNSNQPHCPLCNSTNIRKISSVKRGVHAVAFGLFSTTARSQWECLSCGNKF
jgi:hypothetical protein